MPRNPKTYIETSVVSYLTAWPSRDLILAAHQQITREWWSNRSGYDLYVSQFVIDEASAGDQSAVASRLAALSEATLLDVTEDVIVLGERLILGGGLPAKAKVDALHIAVAAVHGMDYLLTWNCKHIANATMRGRIGDLCREAGFDPPVICTPFELGKE